MSFVTRTHFVSTGLSCQSGEPLVTMCPTQPPHSAATAAAQTGPAWHSAGFPLPATFLLSTTASKALGFLLEAANRGPMEKEARFSTGLPRQPPTAQCLRPPSRFLSPLRPQSTRQAAEQPQAPGKAFIKTRDVVRLGGSKTPKSPSTLCVTVGSTSKGAIIFR